MSTILAAIAGLGTIIGGIVYMMKMGVWIFKKPIAKTQQEIDEKIAEEKHQVQEGGRPKWD